MIKENSFADNPKSFQNKYMEIESEKDMNSSKILENVSLYPELKDSVDDFIKEHSHIIGNNINTYDSFILRSSLVPDVQMKPSNISPIHYFDNDLLLSVLLNSNLKLNKLMYTLALDMQKRKQNTKLKRLIELLRNNRNHEVEGSNLKQVNDSASSHLTCKFSSAISVFNEENVKEVSQLPTKGSRDTINDRSSEIEIHHATQTISIASKRTRNNLSSRKPINKYINEEVHGICSDFVKDYLCLDKIKSELDITTSESKERVLERINSLDQPKSLEDIGNIIEHQIESISFLIADFNEQINKEKYDTLISQYIENKDISNYNKEKKGETDTKDVLSLLSIDEYQTTQQMGSGVFELSKPLEDRNIYAKIGTKMQKINKIINDKDQPKILESIENKIDQLTNSIQLLMGEIKEQKEKEHNLNMLELKNKTEMECNAVQHKTIDTMDGVSSLSIEKHGIVAQNRPIFLELLKNFKNKSKANCYYGSSFNVSLTENATEVTKSSFDPKLNVSKVIMTGTNLKEKILFHNSHTKVNKESLGVFALLRICAQFVKQLWSCVPIIDYSYLGHRKYSILKRNKIPTYGCNICKEVFYKATMLTDHIKEHDFDFARDCGVCKHGLEKYQVNSGKQFKCQFCKERFMRAYCCELHQQSCAERFGLRPDISTNLLLLR